MHATLPEPNTSSPQKRTLVRSIAHAFRRISLHASTHPAPAVEKRHTWHIDKVGKENAALDRFELVETSRNSIESRSSRDSPVAPIEKEKSRRHSMFLPARREMSRATAGRESEKGDERMTAERAQVAQKNVKKKLFRNRKRHSAPPEDLKNRHRVLAYEPTTKQHAPDYSASFDLPFEHRPQPLKRDHYIPLQHAQRNFVKAPQVDIIDFLPTLTPKKPSPSPVILEETQKELEEEIDEEETSQVSPVEKYRHRHSEFHKSTAHIEKYVAEQQARMQKLIKLSTLKAKQYVVEQKDTFLQIPSPPRRARNPRRSDTLDSADSADTIVADADGHWLPPPSSPAASFLSAGGYDADASEGESYFENSGELSPENKREVFASALVSPTDTPLTEGRLEEEGKNLSEWTGDTPTIVVSSDSPMQYLKDPEGIGVIMEAPFFVEDVNRAINYNRK
ncbi:uncharacterized protein VTP21DRAFT_4525 [Calcarisporiella thermophila]|uniref:uncharacterized protein n=1 Tax=Calcarisporiella thermophila TaxID=911321 RepID=UPI003742CE99